MDIASELEKLVTLRDRNQLTDAEFEKAKKNTAFKWMGSGICHSQKPNGENSSKRKGGWTYLFSSGSGFINRCVGILSHCRRYESFALKFYSVFSFWDRFDA